MMKIRGTSLLAALLIAAPGGAAAQDPGVIADGARVWANQCTRCHNARPSTERTDAQWTTIVMHMRARANLTRTQASRVAAFLRATNAASAELSVGAAAPAPSADAIVAALARLTPEQRDAVLAYIRELTPVRAAGDPER